MTNQQLIESFVEGADSGHANNLFIEGDVLYSYGHHFPLAYRTYDGESTIFIVNIDKYSVTTSRHQSLLRSRLINPFFEVIPSSCYDLKRLVN